METNFDRVTSDLATELGADPKAAQRFVLMIEHFALKHMANGVAAEDAVLAATKDYCKHLDLMNQGAHDSAQGLQTVAAKYFEDARTMLANGVWEIANGEGE